MKITFHGAAGEVTGSCHLVQTSTKRILLDCGMFQGSDYNEGKNHDAFPFDPKSIDIILLSHAHNDHSGRIPKLVHDGFMGKIYCTKGTGELAQLIWTDSMHIMQYNNKKFQTPISFHEEDINDAAALIEGIDYDTEIDLGDGHKAIFKDAGHIFGAAFIELSADGKTVGYSGDIGNDNVPILKDTQQLGKVDILLCESTYGNRVHESKQERTEVLLDLIKEGCERGGTIMMPSFSLERTQEILYHLNEMIEKEPSMPKLPVFVDSPLAIRAIPVYKKYSEYYDTEAAEYYNAGDDFLDFPGLTLTETREQSMSINHVPGTKLIIAGSGMMTGGRILHHAKRYLSDPNSMLVIVGYQAKHTLGRRILEGAKKVRIHREEIAVKCKVMAIGVLSAHGDRKKLLGWIEKAKALPKKVVFVHGEEIGAVALAAECQKQLGIESIVAEANMTIEV